MKRYIIVIVRTSSEPSIHDKRETSSKNTAHPMSPQSFHVRLIGAWDILYYKATSTSDLNDVIYPLGAECKGRGIFSPAGYNSAHIQASDIVPYEAGRGFRAAEKELASAARKTLTYTAKYRLEEHSATKATIYYDIDVSLPPNWIGMTEVRELEVEVDGEGRENLYLRPPGTSDINGVERRVEVKTIRFGNLVKGAAKLC